ncbi:hypothetical protein GQX74_010508 [Glossina fuscipes]|nr:hypothetical protein GQX74_010508 [Glossina fuscipes]
MFAKQENSRHTKQVLSAYENIMAGCVIVVCYIVPYNNNNKDATKLCHLNDIKMHGRKSHESLKIKQLKKFIATLLVNIAKLPASQAGDYKLKQMEFCFHLRKGKTYRNYRRFKNIRKFSSEIEKRQARQQYQQQQQQHQQQQ